MSKYRIETNCVQAGYQPQNGEPRVLPIAQSTTYQYDSIEHVGKLFDLTAEGHMYTRISNPTVAAVEAKIAALEGGVGALCTSSGQAANLIALLNIVKCGDHVVSGAAIYGGTTNLFSVTLKRFGIDVSFVASDADEAEIEAAMRPNTKAVFGETLANPALRVFDIERFAAVAHRHGVPLIVDNTFPTPILCRPFEFGADIVTHSTTKYMDGHAVQVGGVIVDSGKFDFTNGNFPEFTEPDESYHGVVYTRDFGSAAYITKARVQLMRDLGSTPSPQNAFYLNLGLETLHLRMARHSENALAVAQFLEADARVASVSYPGLASSPDHALAKKYFPAGASGVVSFCLKGGREAAVRFMDHLKLAKIVVHVADARTSVLHPASTTHRQLTDEQLAAAGVDAGLIRMSVGIENVEDILEDIRSALAAV
ncbi:O-acetylhomoserine aminocarboxypropyltransferase/cysteine synthase family protein [Feifania hominis]|uniref:O-acetylhomoserine aminocarboxypropyltransferase/cysteine synthase n=1 Tax=Feifania hominis TaxID=2763660 RepID=A0A926DGD0_9FIRM|nr:O-acetylhomoserine aminocarboxypropyltransferase/cysteine synthase family protein [Feifania hominis]MBC8536550.1 O-acetylhomoserine aminocarboxypropyltransferase/cysteine synthase [Feifania hominis]